MASFQLGLGSYAKPIAYSSTILLSVSGIATSILFIPALLRPIITVAPAPQKSAPGTPAITRNSSSLDVPSTTEFGRLTPQVSHRTFDFSQHLGSSGTYKAVARQFAQLQALSSLYNVPLETLAVGSFGALAYSEHGTTVWKNWAATAGIIVGIDILKAWFMAPLALKLLRIAGDAEPVEPYEDAPIDREAEKSNTVQFLRKWSTLNLATSVAILGTTMLAWSAEI